MRMPARWVALVAVGLLLGCGAGSTASGGSPSLAPRPTTSPSPSPQPQPYSPPATAGALPADVAALPDGGGAAIAVVVDDVGGADTYLEDYLSLPVPLTFAVLPMTARATQDDARVTARGRPVLLHVPLPIASDLRPSGGLPIDASPAQAAAYVDAALERVPHAVGANNHQGSLGTSTPALVQALLPALQRRGLWFLDSVTSQDTVAYAAALALGMPSRINNVFLDNDDSDAAARRQLVELARLAARHGSAVGICHVHRPYQLHALQVLAGPLAAHGYRFLALTEVTDHPAGGLDAGVRR